MYNYYYKHDNNIPAIVFYTHGDVNGDGISDNLYLTGITTPSSPFVKNITLIMQDGRTGQFIKVPLSENAGYNPQIFLGDFTGDRINDVLISINSGGSGGIMFYYIYSFIYDIPKLIFDFNKYNEMYTYNINYKDNYKVEALSNYNNEKYIIDISLKGKDYLNEIYYADGKLKNPIEGFVNPLSGLYPVDFDYDGVYELLAYQKIAGRYNADSLGYFLNTLKYNSNNFILYNQNIAILGA